MRVLVTSPDAAELTTWLADRGARPVHVPTIEVRPLDDPALGRALAGIEDYDWIVVTSANGAAALLDRLAGRDAPRARWAAVGPKTAAALAAGGIKVAHVPEAGVGAAIPDGMGALAGARVLLARARRAGADLPRILRARDAVVDDVAVYQTVEGPDRSREPLARALDAGIDAAIFTSGSCARGFVRLAGSAAALGTARVVCIGPTTARAAERAGFRPASVACERTPAGLVAALEAALADTNPERSR